MTSLNSQTSRNEPPNDMPRHWRPNVSQNTSATRTRFAPLTSDEQATYHRWRWAIFGFYGVFACVIAAITIAIGPKDQSTAASDSGVHSTLASTERQRPN